LAVIWLALALWGHCSPLCCAVLLTLCCLCEGIALQSCAFRQVGHGWGREVLYG
jgi:hypothetical protein